MKKENVDTLPGSKLLFTRFIKTLNFFLHQRKVFSIDRIDIVAALKQLPRKLTKYLKKETFAYVPCYLG